MYLIEPIPILDAVLVSSDVVEAPPAAYAGGTTYAIGNTVSVAGANAVREVYKSLQNANTGHAPAASPTWWKHTGTTYLAYAGGTTYALGDRVIVVAADVHKTYESLQAANTGHAVTDEAWWLDLGATNRWAMFDGAVQSQTTNPDSIGVSLLITDRIDTLSLQNISAATAHIVQTDPVEGVVYDETISLVSTEEVTDWSTYFDAPIERVGDLDIVDLRRFLGTTLTVTLADAGAVVACGEALVGLGQYVGDTAWGGQVGITDLSVKTRDDFGNLRPVERAFYKMGSFNLVVPAASVDRVQRLFARLRATPVLIIGDPDYSSTSIYGFIKSFNMVLDNPKVSFCDFDFEGLT